MTPQFKPGDRVRWNYWTDRRESGWHYGTVESKPTLMYGAIGYQVHGSTYSSWMNAELLEPVEVSE